MVLQGTALWTLTEGADRQAHKRSQALLMHVCTLMFTLPGKPHILPTCRHIALAFHCHWLHKRGETHTKKTNNNNKKYTHDLKILLFL